MFFKVASRVLNTVYGLLMIYASIVAMAGNSIPYWISVLFILASIVLIIGNTKLLPKNTVFVAAALVVIQGCALLDSLYMEFNLMHHIVRLIAHGILFAIFLVSQRQRRPGNPEK
jgi:hypothetical protein